MEAVHGAVVPPDVLVWEADGTVDGSTGYGGPLATRLRAAGFIVDVVPLTQRRPNEAELAAPAHVVSGGTTGVGAGVAWLQATRDALGPVLERALDGRSSIVGVCFGAQLIARELAGPAAVGVHPAGLQAGLVEVCDAIGITDAERPADPAGIVSSFHYHWIEPGPIQAAGARIVLESERTPVQAFEMGAGVRGLQFHPELEPRQLRRTLRANRSVVERQLVSMGAVNRSIAAAGRRWDTALWEGMVLDPISSVRPTVVAA